MDMNRTTGCLKHNTQSLQTTQDTPANQATNITLVSTKNVTHNPQAHVSMNNMMGMISAVTIAVNIITQQWPADSGLMPHVGNVDS